MSTAPAAGLAAPLLARLEGVIPAGPGRWHARCPAHGDKPPSLSIRDTGDRVLIHCFAGCDPSGVLRAVGLDWPDIYPAWGSWPLARGYSVTRGRAMRELERRVGQLESQAETDQSVLLVIGEPTPEQQTALDAGRIKAAVFIPDNGRDNLRGSDEQTH